MNAVPLSVKTLLQWTGICTTGRALFNYTRTETVFKYCVFVEAEVSEIETRLVKPHNHHWIQDEVNDGQVSVETSDYFADSQSKISPLKLWKVHTGTIDILIKLVLIRLIFYIDEINKNRIDSFT